MNLIETYSHYCGVKPQEAFIDEVFYPIPFDKYIVVHNGTGMQTKSYDNFPEICEALKMPIVQVGGKEDPLLPNVLDIRGRTTWNQTSFIIGKSTLFLGGDSVCSHMAAHHKIPSIILWGGTLPSTCSTNWNPKQINMTPIDRMGCATACHSNTCIRAKKCINTITVSSILNTIKRLLGNQYVNDIDVIFKGEAYNTNVLEWIPLTINQDTYNILSKSQGTVSVRGDLCNVNLEELSNFCNQLNLKFVFILKPQDFSKFNVHQSKTEHVVVLVDLTNIKESISLLKQLSNRGYRVRFISKLPHTDFNDFKIDLFDFPNMLQLKDYEYSNYKHLIGNSYRIKTNRRVFGTDGKCYMSLYDAENDKNSIDIFRNSDILKVEEQHLKEMQFLTIIKEL
jgi:hypothetical protein